MKMMMRGASSRGSSLTHSQWTNISPPLPFNDINNNKPVFDEVRLKNDFKTLSKSVFNKRS